MPASASRAAPIPSRLFADRVFTLLFAVQLVLLAVALVFTPAVIALLAPGFAKDPGRFALAVELTRITFPYLLLVSLVTLYGGILNALGRFASAAAAPILLNLSMIAALALAVVLSDRRPCGGLGRADRRLLEVLLLAADARRQGVLPAFRWPRLDQEVKLFLKRFGPATIGSAETQIALFADTIIASFLAAGALSALYYADRLNQLPIGVIGIAVGTVLLPEMANRLARGDEARRAPRAEPRDRIHAAAVDPLPRRVPAGSRTDHARAVRARRLHRRRRARPPAPRLRPMRSACCRSC